MSLAANFARLARIMLNLSGKHVLLGVTGSIAAYKAAELVRRLREHGASVRVVMTQAATAFVGPLTFQALSGEPVRQRLLDADAEAAMGHIDLARWADVVVVAPASADFLARLAQGRADDLLAALCLATRAPLVVAPAMNQQMWAASATQDNAALLRRRGVHVLGPGVGEQACGEVGPGRMVEPGDIIEGIGELFATGSLAGRTVLVTAGATREALDPVRFLSNHSSGKMGTQVAIAAAEAGAHVVLIAGPTDQPVPPGIERIDVTSAQEMLEAVLAHVVSSDIFVAAAAVADYRPRHPHDAKIKKSESILTLELEPCPDILATVSRSLQRPFCVGFAAETDALETHARDKLRRKGLDMIAANWVGPAAAATNGTFGSDTNALQIFWPGGQAELPSGSKSRLARQLVALIAQRYRTVRPAGAGSARVVNMASRAGAPSENDEAGA